MKRLLCWIGLGSLSAAAVFCCLYPAMEWLLPLAALLGLVGIFSLLHKRTYLVALAFLSAVAMLLFCALYQYRNIRPLASFPGKTLSLSGIVLETGRSSFLLKGTTAGGQALKIQVWCSTDMVPDRFAQFSGTVQCEQIRSTDRFDSESYYRSRNIFLQGQLSEGSFTKPDSMPLWSLPGRLNDFLCGKVQQLLPEQASALVNAAVLGNRSALSDEQYELFEQLGIQHLLAVSGIHLTILTGMVSLVLRRSFLGRRGKLVCQMLFVVFYLLLTGMSPSILRAGIMLLLSFAAQLIWRQTDAPTSLAAAVLCMLYANPFLAMNTGFQFSVLTTIGVRILASPMAEMVVGLWKRKPCPPVAAKWIRGCSVAFCACACAIPLTVLYDGCFVPLSIPANLMLSPLFTPVLIAGSLLVLFCAIPFLGAVFAFPAFFLSNLFLKAAGLLAKIGPGPVYADGPAPVIAALCIIVAIGYGAYRANRRAMFFALCVCVLLSSVSISAQAWINSGQIYGYTAAFEKRILQIFTYRGHAVVIGHLSGQAQIEQAAQELKRQNVHTVDCLMLLPNGGDPRVSFAALTESFSVSAVVYSDQDNLSTQAAESLSQIPAYDIEHTAVEFWQTGTVRLLDGGAVDLSVGAKKLLILPADCAILEQEQSHWDLVITSWDTPVDVSADALLCARDFWGEDGQHPHAFLLYPGRGVRYRIAATS